MTCSVRWYKWAWPETVPGPPFPGATVFKSRARQLRLMYDLLHVQSKTQYQMIEALRALFKRDLDKLQQEIGLYVREENIWKVEGQIANSAGNLCLHLVGNLNTYIGKEIGKTDYIRNRDLEFSQKNLPRAELLRKVQDTTRIVDKSLSRLNEIAMEEEYPLQVFDKRMTTGYFLVHLAMHLSYHLGQVNYHRRLLDK